MKDTLRGIIPPIVTPLNNNKEIDEKGLNKLLKHVIEGGVHGIFLLGTTGEAPNLSYKLRKEFINMACNIINKRVQVVVGITDTCIEGSLEIAECAKNAGADALVVAPPYYVPISQNEMVEYLEDLVPQLPLPFLMYNMPSCTKLHMSVDTIKKAKELGAIGIKDSSGDITYLHSLIEAFKDSPDFSIITGTEIHIPESIIHGAHGAVAGGANMYPRLFVDFYEAARAKNLEQMELLRDKVSQIGKNIYDIVPEASRHIKTTKCALSVLGICNDYVAPPLRKFGDIEKNKIKQNISNFDF